MRKISTKASEEKKSKRNQIIVGILLVVIMLFSTLGYAFNSGDNSMKKIKFRDYKFVEYNSYWNLEDTNLVFAYNPLEINRINSNVNKIGNYQGKVLNLYSENSEAEVEIIRNLFYENGIVTRVQNACLEIETELPWEENWEKECEENSPVKSCENNFILIIEDSQERIFQQDNCVFITGPAENLTQIADEFLFKILDIV